MKSSAIFSCVFLLNSIWTSEPSLLERLYKKTEERYQQQQGSKQASSDEPEQPATQPEPKPEPKIVVAEPIKPMPSRLHKLRAQTKFSDEWWRTLLDKCDGCNLSDYQNGEEIDCEWLLKKNSQWKEVQRMSPSEKNIVTQQALDELRRARWLDRPHMACNLACALCSGGDPNIRDQDQHLAAHVVMDKAPFPRDLALFKLLLKKGARPQELCIRATLLEIAFTETNGPRWAEAMRPYVSRADWEAAQEKYQR